MAHEDIAVFISRTLSLSPSYSAREYAKRGEFFFIVLIAPTTNLQSVLLPSSKMPLHTYRQLAEDFSLEMLVAMRGGLLLWDRLAINSRIYSIQIIE